jgi:deazaflavin-dependent oxidoreductase (nitroreductase family)
MARPDRDRQTDPMSTLSSLARRYGNRPWFARLGRAYVPIDRLLGKLSGGRFVAFGLRELPSMLLTTTGRKSGQPRTTPLLFAPDGDSFIVIGSNWGQRHHPAWSGNLLANPAATVMLNGEEIPVRAHLARDEERVRLRAKLLEVWPAYTAYEQRCEGRDLRIFRLERTG